MGIVERKERQRTEMRSAILDAAWQVVMETGWQSLSIRKIADAIEYSVPVVYEYFENKEAILSEFNQQGYKLLNEKIIEAKHTAGNPEQQLEAVVYAYWNFAFDNQAYYQLMFGLGMPTCEHARSMPELTRFTGEIESVILEISAESGKKIIPFLKVHSFWSMIHGLVSINLMAPVSSHGGMAKEELNNLVLKDFITGFITGLKT